MFCPAEMHVRVKVVHWKCVFLCEMNGSADFKSLQESKRFVTFLLHLSLEQGHPYLKALKPYSCRLRVQISGFFPSQDSGSSF